MTDRIRIIPHSPGIPNCGSFEIRFPDGRESRYIYWDDDKSRRAVTGKPTKEQALEQAKEIARAERERMG